MYFTINSLEHVKIKKKLSNHMVEDGSNPYTKWNSKGNTVRSFLVKNKILFTVIRTRLQSSHFSHYNFQEHCRGGPPIVLGVSISQTHKINFPLSFGHLLDKVFLWGNLAMDLGDECHPWIEGKCDIFTQWALNN